MYQSTTLRIALIIAHFEMCYYTTARELLETTARELRGLKNFCEAPNEHSEEQNIYFI